MTDHAPQTITLKEIPGSMTFTLVQPDPKKPHFNFIINYTKAFLANKKAQYASPSADDVLLESAQPKAKGQNRIADLLNRKEVTESEFAQHAEETTDKISQKAETITHALAQTYLAIILDDMSKPFTYEKLNTPNLIHNKEHTVTGVITATEGAWADIKTLAVVLNERIEQLNDHLKEKNTPQTHIKKLFEKSNDYSRPFSIN